jgi:outer membrane protein TolC
MLGVAVLAGLALFAGSPAEAGEGAPPVLDFARVWSMVAGNDPALKASAEDREAARIGAERAARHWYPRIFASGRAFVTNDPATSFMFTLEQRQIAAADFAPGALNQPGNSFFGLGSLGVDMPLFEGGMKVAQARAAEKGAAAKEWEAKAQSSAEYARVARDYAGLLALVEERRQLQELQGSVQGILEHYSIGSKANPVGYSGLLGLKNLNNRLEGLLAQNEAADRSKRSSIEVAAARSLPEQWRPTADRASDFLARVFPGPAPASVPAPVQAARLGAESLSSAKDGERARFLPKVGVFAEGDLYDGSRAAASSYSAGAYLQWDLLSAPNLGAVGEAEHRAAAAEARADALAARMAGDHDAAVAGTAAAEKTLKLLDESAALLSEQTRTARELFRSGAINALQLVEVLNRRADLLASRRDAELMLAQAKAAVFLTSAGEGVSR